MQQLKQRKIFGTDGVRGTSNIEPMTPETIMRLAVAAGQHFTRGTHRHMVVIGKDTRLSGYMVEPALTAGFIAVGMDVTLVGPLPTPAVAMLTRSLRADFGVVISASHNNYEYNGLKLFGPDGYKLTDSIEKQIESAMHATPKKLVSTRHMGRARRLDDSPGRYIEFVKNTFIRHKRLDGLRIVIDCANGAAYRVAPPVFWELGADIIPINVQPDGCNINYQCGALHIDTLRKAVLKNRAEFGIALDGDADRVVMVDDKGGVIDGDQILGLVASSWSKTGNLRGGRVVGTVMSNLGLERYLNEKGIGLVRAKVGDRYVSERMRHHGCNVGGEPSGHIILNDYTTTGDGLIAALQVLAVIIKSGRLASDIAHVFKPVPQVLRSVQILKDQFHESKRVQQSILKGQNELKDKGRLLVRKSGTEPVIRLMAEGENKKHINQVIDSIIDVMCQEGYVAVNK
jgi:phosphoglucosamine mutase